MKIAMVGSGYVGLVSGACFADFGNDFVCTDKDPSKIERLNACVMPIYEPGLGELAGSNVKAGQLSFTTDLAEGIAGASAIFIAVGTPSRRGDGHADLQYVQAIASAQALQDAGVAVTGYDPEGMEMALSLMPGVAMKDSAYAAIEGADKVVIVTEWDAFRALDFERIKGLAKAPVLIDLRNVYDPADVCARGFAYSSVGRV